MIDKSLDTDTFVGTTTDYVEQEAVPFEVGEVIEVGDLTSVQPEVLPVCNNVLMAIRKAERVVNEDKTLKSLKLELTLVNGIPVTYPDTGEQTFQYRNKIVFPTFMDLCIWASPTRPDPKGWFARKQHLLGFKEFCTALGIDLKQVRVDDAFCQALLGRQLLGGVRHEIEKMLDPTTGKRMPTGRLRERIGNWKKYEEGKV